MKERGAPLLVYWLFYVLGKEQINATEKRPSLDLSHLSQRLKELNTEHSHSPTNSIDSNESADSSGYKADDEGISLSPDPNTCFPSRIDYINKCNTNVKKYAEDNGMCGSFIMQSEELRNPIIRLDSISSGHAETAEESDRL